MTTSSARAIIHITASGRQESRISYTRRMYAIIRRYVPDVAEGATNECFADLTGLRTFFKMTYAEIAEKIKQDLTKDLGVRFTVRVATAKAFTEAKNRSKKSQSISTYKEMNKLFIGSSFVEAAKRTGPRTAKRRFTVPFIGKVN